MSHMPNRIVIFGNGELGAAAQLAHRSELVIRFNDCRSAGEFAARTDIVAVCNTGRPAKEMLEGDAWRSSDAVLAASGICCVRAPERYAKMRSEMVDTYPELDDYCDDYTEEFERFARETGKDLMVVPAATHEQLEAELKELGANDFVSPSSGLLLTAAVLETLAGPGDEVVIAGFSHQGWALHPWTAEKRWVDARVAEGRLLRAEQIDEEKTYQEFKTHAL